MKLELFSNCLMLFCPSFLPAIKFFWTFYIDMYGLGLLAAVVTNNKFVEYTLFCLG